MPGYVFLRALPHGAAKIEVLDWFRWNPGAYPSDAALELRLDPYMVLVLARELVSEGKLFEDS